MVVWFAHVRVGHRQLSILKYPPTRERWGIFFVRNLVTDLLISVEFILASVL